jgi:hypothetical protein
LAIARATLSQGPARPCGRFLGRLSVARLAPLLGAHPASSPPPPRSLGTISLLFLPALGWVAFNILGPLTNQLSRMNEMASEDTKPAGKKRRGVAGAVGLGAALALATAQQADAATELAQVAASDGRLGTIALLFLPALGWVAFNMLGPLTNQLNRMSEMASEDAKPAGKKRR